MSARRRSRSLGFRGLAVVALSLIAGIVWPAGAVAGGWVLSSFGAGVPYSYGPYPGLAMNGAGEAALIFGFNGVRVSLRPAGGSFEDPEWGGVRVSAENVEGSTPAVAIDARGDVVAVWQQYTGPHRQIYGATRPAGGSFGAPLAVSPENEEASAPSVAIDAQGDATVAWLNNDGASEVVEAARAPLGGAFSSPVGLSGDGGNASSPQVSADPGGDAIVSWEREGAGGSRLEVAISRAGGSFSAPAAQGDGEALGEVAASARPHVVIDQAGEALAVWRAPGGEVRSARLLGSASSFGSAVTLASTTGVPSAAMNEAGEAVAAWPSGLGVQVAAAAPGAAFGPPAQLPSSFVPSATQIAIGAFGDTSVEWERTTEEGSSREGSSRPPGGTFAKPTSIYTSETALEGSLVVSSDSAGDMVGVWSSTRLEDMRSMLYDAGPRLGAISAPASAMAGQPLAFSIASPPSVWRPLNSTTWTFGDGATASGLSVGHVYAAPGTYQVTVTATDTQHTGLPFDPALFPEYVGSTESHTVTVSSPPAAQGSQTYGAATASESLSGLRVTPRSFLAAASGSTATAASHHGVSRTGTMVRFMLALPGLVTFGIDRPIAGVKRGGRCLPQRSRLLSAHVRRCALLRTLGRFARSGSAGSNSFHFTGRVNAAKLSPGSYLLLASAEGTHQPPRKVAFRVVSR